MLIALASDHAGMRLKLALKTLLVELGHEFVDHGADGDAPVDYPVYTFRLAEAVGTGAADLGIFTCGSGLGPAIAANKVPGVRAVTCHDVYSARSSRRDNNANVLCMGERVIGVGVALEVARVWLAEPFSHAERHQRRLEMIDEAMRRYVCGEGAAGGRLSLAPEE